MAQGPRLVEEEFSFPAEVLEVPLAQPAAWASSRSGARSGASGIE